jgi:hypothetical protein
VLLIRRASSTKVIPAEVGIQSRSKHAAEPGLRLLSEKDVRVLEVNQRQGDDLAKFLRLKETLRKRFGSLPPLISASGKPEILSQQP